MNHFLYILYSESKDKFYVGETGDVLFRLELHNDHSFAGAFTKIASDWKIVLQFETKTKEESIFLEKFIKRMKSKKFIQKIISEPEILIDILRKK